MARVVVTGGAGKLGRACVEELVGHGWDVVVFATLSRTHWSTSPLSRRRGSDRIT